MLHKTDKLYLVKLDNKVKYGLIRCRIAEIQDTMNHYERLKNRYFIAKKIRDKFLLLNKTKLNGDKIYINTNLVKIVKSIQLNTILSNPKSYYSDKEVKEIENCINNVKLMYKDDTIINGEKTRQA